MTEQQQIIELLKEQNELLKRHLWRLRFSLLFLMLMTTALCLGLGFIVYQARPKPAAPVFAPVTPNPLWGPTPTPTPTRTPTEDIRAFPSRRG
jgi:hypothetical protein